MRLSCCIQIPCEDAARYATFSCCGGHCTRDPDLAVLAAASFCRTLCIGSTRTLPELWLSGLPLPLRSFLQTGALPPGDYCRPTSAHSDLLIRSRISRTANKLPPRGVSSQSPIHLSADRPVFEGHLLEQVCPSIGLLCRIPKVVCQRRFANRPRCNGLLDCPVFEAVSESIGNGVDTWRLLTFLVIPAKAGIQNLFIRRRCAQVLDSRPVDVGFTNNDNPWPPRPSPYRPG